MIRGSLVPNITIFDAKGKIDEAKTSWHMDWMFSHGVDGLFLTGSYGAGPLMSHDERVQVYQMARKVADKHKNKQLLPHVGCIDTAGTVALAQAAEKVGVDAVGAVPPFYYKHTDEIITAFYKELISSVKIPVYAYNNPETSRYTFNLKVVRELQESGLKGIKDSPLNVGFLSSVAYEMKVQKKDFQIVLGTSTGWLPLHYMGVDAAIAGMNNWAPEVMTELFRATFAKEWDKAELAYTVMMDLSRKMHFTDSTIASHMALRARGFDSGYPRKPMMLPADNDPKYDQIKVWLKEGFDTLGLQLK